MDRCPDHASAFRRVIGVCSAASRARFPWAYQSPRQNAHGRRLLVSRARAVKQKKATKGTVAMTRNEKFLNVVALCCIALGALAAPTVQHYYCKYCGHKTTSVNSLTASSCQRHPEGPGKGRHSLYEGGEKESYVCKYCGLNSTSIASLTSSKCQRHRNGPQKGRHAPAL